MIEQFIESILKQILFYNGSLAEHSLLHTIIIDNPLF